jgi:transcription termination factor NusB
MSAARGCALAVTRRVFEQGAYADRALAAEAVELDPRDRALATQIAYGTVQRRATLDHVARPLVRRPLERLEPVVLAAIRIGLFQLLYLERVPTHAVVNETVELVKRDSRGGAGLVNAVLRRAAREGASLLGGLGDTTPADAAVLHSVPEWLAQLWWSELGAVQARALLRRINDPAEGALRVNTLVSGVDDVLEALPVPASRVCTLRRAGIRALAQRRDHSPVTGVDARHPPARARARPARARPVRSTGREDDASGSADPRSRRDRGGRAPPGPCGGARAELPEDASELGQGRDRRCRRGPGGRRV